MKEVRAVVLGLLVLVIVALAISVWRRPARELRHLSGFRVEVVKQEGSSRKHVSFHVPISVVARLASFIPISDFGGDWSRDWTDNELTARDILDAADKSAPGQPVEIERGRKKIEVTADGKAIDIAIKDDWDRKVRIRVPRALIESLSSDRRISPREILRRLDELGPGDVVVIHDRDDEVTITAEGR
jgi:hypothetical protein